MADEWSESSIIAQIRKQFRDILAEGARDLIDDGAWLPPCTDSSTRVISCDTFVEEVDFSLSLSPAYTAGHRVVVQNLSDLAAMGAKPLGFLWSLEIPKSWLENKGTLLWQFCEGAKNVCTQENLSFYGGDLTNDPHRFGCSITIVGDVAGTPLSRQGANPGDVICLSRPVGASQKGLSLLFQARKQAKYNLGDPESFKSFLVQQEPNVRDAILNHLEPSAEIRLGQLIKEFATSCIDISDGFAKDLHRLCQASSVGAIVDSFELARHSSSTNKKEHDYALFGGEEYALLFTVSNNTFQTLKYDGLQSQIIPVGKIVDNPGSVIIRNNSKDHTLPARGYDHFESDS